jgi:hypothetical protein
VIIPITVSAWPVRACRETGARLALDARDGGRTLMHGVVPFLGALAIMVLAAVGAALIHYNFLWTDSLGIGMGVFALVGAFMLARVGKRRREGLAPEASDKVGRSHESLDEMTKPKPPPYPKPPRPQPGL